MNIKKLVAKIRSIKNIELYLAAILGIAVLVAVFFGTSTKTDKTTEDSSEFDEYIATMENKISSVIEKMDGCRNVEVAVSYNAVGEKVFAYETETKNVNGVIVEVNSIVFVKGEPLVLKTLPPSVCGVVIVVDCNDDPVLKMKIKQVVVTLLEVSVDNVQVFTYKN